MVRYHPPVDEEDGDPPRRRIDRGVIIVGLVVLAGAGAVVYLRGNARHELEATPGHPEGAVVARGTKVSTLVVIDRVSSHASSAASYRLTAVDPATGRVLTSRVVDEAVRCWPGEPDRIWCDDAAGHAHELAVPSFDAVATSIAPPVRIDPRCNLVDSVPVGVDHLAFGAGTQRPLMRHASHPEGVEPVSASLPGTPSFVSPSFLVVDDPAVLLVLHDVSLERPGARQLSRVTDDLHVTWTADVGPVDDRVAAGDCETAAIVGDKLVITTRDRANRAIAIDLVTGKLAWRFALQETN